jgi:hypothetical protein
MNRFVNHLIFHWRERPRGVKFEILLFLAARAHPRCGERIFTNLKRVAENARCSVRYSQLAIQDFKVAGWLREYSGEGQRFWRLFLPGMQAGSSRHGRPVENPTGSAENSERDRMEGGETIAKPATSDHSGIHQTIFDFNGIPRKPAGVDPSVLPSLDPQEQRIPSSDPHEDEDRRLRREALERARAAVFAVPQPKPARAKLRPKLQEAPTHERSGT